MAYEILMPQLGLTMEEGTVTRWVKQEGDSVSTGDVLLEITTDKLTSEIVSEYDGVLLKIVAQEGEDIPVKGVLGYVGQAGEAVNKAAKSATAEPEKPAAAPVAAPVMNVAAGEKKRVRISPFARKLAASLNVAYEDLIGSGPSGRIVAADIRAAAERATAAPVVTTSAVEPTPTAAAVAPAEKKISVETEEGDTVVKLTGMRKVVAERMLKSHTEIPPVTQNTRVDVTELMKFRKMLIGTVDKKYSVNDLIIKAVAKVLRQHPEICVSLQGDMIVQHSHINIGMAVALDAGLIVPVIRDADKMGMDELAAAAKDLAVRARENKLTADEYKGSTFTISNLGMFGIESFTPIVNQPNAGILGVCAIQDELMMDDEGNITKHQVMRLSFTYDHRLIDGAVAAKFVMDLRDLLQTPMNLLL